MLVFRWVINDENLNKNGRYTILDNIIAYIHKGTHIYAARITPENIVVIITTTLGIRSAAGFYSIRLPHLPNIFNTAFRMILIIIGKFFKYNSRIYFSEWAFAMKRFSIKWKRHCKSRFHCSKISFVHFLFIFWFDLLFRC